MELVDKIEESNYLKNILGNNEMYNYTLFNSINNLNNLSKLYEPSLQLYNTFLSATANEKLEKLKSEINEKENKNNLLDLFDNPKIRVASKTLQVY